MNMQNTFGMPSRLITFYKIPFNFPEDICVNLPIPRNKLAMKWRDLKLKKIQGEIKCQERK